MRLNRTVASGQVIGMHTCRRNVNLRRRARTEERLTDVRLIRSLHRRRAFTKVGQRCWPIEYIFVDVGYAMQADLVTDRKDLRRRLIHIYHPGQLDVCFKHSTRHGMQAALVTTGRMQT